MVPPPTLDAAQQEELKGAAPQLPAASGIELANWYWKGDRQFVWEGFGVSPSRSSCLNYLHRLGFACKRPKKRLVKANEAKREAFVAECAALGEEAQRTGAQIFLVDVAHFRADAALRVKWALKGAAALVVSTGPRHGEKASYYSAVCLETGEVEWMEPEGNRSQPPPRTPMRGREPQLPSFLTQQKARQPGSRQVIWDNAPAHRGEALRERLGTPGLGLRLVNPVSSTGQALPGCSPDFNADEGIWGWAR